MTKEDKLKVLDLMEIYYHDRMTLNNEQEKELINFVDELKEAINYSRCSSDVVCANGNYKHKENTKANDLERFGYA